MLPNRCLAAPKGRTFKLLWFLGAHNVLSMYDSVYLLLAMVEFLGCLPLILTDIIKCLIYFVLAFVDSA